jgi:hypothetical protein
MAYLGPPPSQKLATPTSQYFSGNGSATAFTLNRPVNVAEDLNVYVNNVAQQPGSGKSYTATGTTLTFDAAPDAGTNNVYVVYRGLSEGTLRLEGTTTGIDDNADATAITISSGELVGIGEISPTSALHIKGGAGTNLAIQSTAGTHWRIGDGVGSTNGSLVIYDYTDSRKVFEIDTLGRVTKPAQPVFSAILDSSPTAASNAIIPVNSAIVNIGSHFNNSTYTFTAPVSGNYFLSYFVRYNGYQANIYLHPRFYKNGSALFETHQIASTGGSPGYTSLTWSGVVQLAANDAITLHDASQGSVTLGTYQASQTGFTGHLIG